MMKFAAAFFLCATVVGAQEGEKKLLRYSFKKGEKVVFDTSMKMKATLDKIPELLEGTLEKDAVDVTMSGRFSGVVVKVTPSKSRSNSLRARHAGRRTRACLWGTTK